MAHCLNILKKINNIINNTIFIGMFFDIYKNNKLRWKNDSSI